MGQQITLGGAHYAILESLGESPTAQVYLAAISGQQAVLRLHTDAQPETVAAVRREADILRVMNNDEDKEFAQCRTVAERARWAARTTIDRVIVACLDSGYDAQGRPYIVHEPVPAAITPALVQSLSDEFHVIQIMQRVARGVALAHAHDYGLRDFEPQTRLDRIRVMWGHPRAAPVVRLIGWSISGGPEDFTQDLFYFGGHLFCLLLGQHLELGPDNRPPHALGLGLPAWDAISEGSKGILTKLLHRDVGCRYPNATDLAGDLAWLERSIELALFEASTDRLRERAYEARGQGRFDYLLAVADLALRRLTPGDVKRSAFETLRDQARNELEKVVWKSLAMARVSLLAKQYGQAIASLERQLDILDPRDEPARHARYLLLRAQIGDALRERGVPEPTQTLEWAAIERGIAALLGKVWLDAGQELAQALIARPDLTEVAAFKSLQGMAEAGQLQEQARTWFSQVQPPAADGSRRDWLATEEAQVRLLEQAFTAFERAVMLAPEEPLLSETFDLIQRDLERRAPTLQLLKDAEGALAAEHYEEAEASLEKIKERDAKHPRASYLLPEARHKAQFQTSWTAGRQLLAANEYQRALSALRHAARLVPGSAQVATLLAVAEAGTDLEMQLTDALDGCERLIARDVRAAEAELRRVNSLRGRNLGLLSISPGGSALAQPKSFFPAQALQDRLAELERRLLVRKAEEVSQALSQARQSWTQLRFAEAEYSLTKVEDLVTSEQRGEVDQWLLRIKQADALIRWAPRQIAIIRETWQTGEGAGNGGVLTSIAEILEQVAGGEDLPEVGRSAARRLGDTIQQFVQSPNSDLMWDGPIADFLQPAQSLIADAIINNLRSQAAAARTAGHPMQTRDLLTRSRRLTNVLSDQEGEWLAWADKAIQGQVTAETQLSHAQRALHSPANKLRPEISQRIEDARSALAPDDRSDQADRIRADIEKVSQINEAADYAANLISWWRKQAGQAVVETTQARDNLLALDNALKMLAVEAPFLAQEYEKSAILFLEPHLKKALQQAQARAKGRDDAVIMNYVSRAEALLPAPHWRAALSDHWQRLHQIKGEVILRRVEAAWKRLDYTEGFRLLTDVKENANPDQIAILETWHDKLTRSADLVEWLSDETSALRQALARPAATPVEVLQELGVALDKLAESADIPDSLRDEACRLRAAAQNALDCLDEPPAPPEAVAQELKDVRELLAEALTAELHVRAERAHAEGQYACTIALLGHLSTMRALNASEADWRAMAEGQSKAHGHLKDAERSLASQPMVTDDVQSHLSDALNALRADDTSTGAHSTRAAVAKHWRELVRAQPDPLQTEKCAKAGEEALAGWQLADKLTADLRLLALAEQIQSSVADFQRLTIDGSNLAAAQTQLAVVMNALSALKEGESGWAKLSDWANQRWDDIRRRLTSWLDHLKGKAEIAQKESCYLDAVKWVGLGKALAGAEPWRTLLADELADMEALRRQVAPLAENRAALEKLLAQLEGNKLVLGTGEASRRIVALQVNRERDPGLATTLERLGYAQTLAEICQQGTVADADYAHVLHEALTALRTSVSGDAGTEKDRLRDEIARLVTAGWNRVATLVRNLAEDLLRERDQFVQHPESEPTRSVSLLWQARWALAALASSGNKVGAEAVDSLRAAMDKSAAILVDMAAGPFGNKVLDAVEHGAGAAQEALKLTQALQAWRRICDQQPTIIRLPAGPLQGWELQRADKLDELEQQLKLLLQTESPLDQEACQVAKIALLEGMDWLLSVDAEIRLRLERLGEGLGQWQEGAEKLTAVQAAQERHDAGDVHVHLDVVRRVPAEMVAGKGMGSAHQALERIYLEISRQIDSSSPLPSRPFQWVLAIVAILVLLVIGTAIREFGIERWPRSIPTMKPDQLSTQAPIVAPSPTVRARSISLIPTELALPADGQSTHTILVQVRDKNYQPASQKRITISLQGPGVLTSGSNEATTNQIGEVTLTYTSGTIPGQAILRVSVDEAAAILVIKLTTLPVTRSP